jgi:hypothetical protein
VANKIGKRTDLEKEFDNDLSPAKPHKLTIPFDTLLDEQENSMPELAQAEKQVRGWLRDGRFTKEVGPYLAAETERVYEQSQRMNDAERQLYQA